MKRSIFIILLQCLAVSMIIAQSTSHRGSRKAAVTPTLTDSFPVILESDTLFFPTLNEAIETKVKYEIAKISTYDTFPEGTTFQDTIIVNPIFLPLTFESRALPQPLRLYRSNPYNAEKSQFQRWFPTPKFTIDSLIRLDSLNRDRMFQLAVTHPELAHYNREMLNKAAKIKDDVKQLNPTDLYIPADFAISLPAQQKMNIQGLNIGPKNWIHQAQFSTQITNNFISDNWYQGGENNTTLYSSFNFKIKYEDYKRLVFENEVDWRLGFYSSPKDTVNSFRVSEDQLRLLSKLGYKALEKLYYSASLEFKTKLFDAFKPNTRDKANRTAAFLSPAELYLGVGFEYKDKFDKANIEYLNISLSPITYTMKYRNDLLIPVSGILTDEHALHSYGSMIRASAKWKIQYNLAWESRIYYFSTYKNIEAECENTIQYFIRHNLSAKLFFIVRYDDKRKLVDEKDSYFQFKEYLSFGLSFRF